MFIYDDDDTNALEGLGSYNNTNAGVWYSTGGKLWGKEANKHLDALQEIQSRGLSEEKQVQAIVDYERKNKVSFTRREMQAAGIVGAVIGAVLTLPIGGLGAIAGKDIGNRIAHKKELRRYKKELLQDAQDSDSQDSDAQESAIEEALETLLSE